MPALIVLESDRLRIAVDPMLGGTIRSVEHLELGTQVLGKVPWNPETTPLDPAAVTDPATWLSRYTGGWSILFPNGGDACTFRGVFHGFHGEGSIAPWDMRSDADRFTLR